MIDLYPAIDLLGGRCVRLYQGDYGRETVYGDDPVAQAKAFEAAGAPWIHVVDLDAARTGEPVNREVVGAIAVAVGVPVQTGGGVRDEAAAEALFEAGVARVVLGTAALEDPDLVRRLAARYPVTVGLDARGREVAVRGWLKGSGADVLDLARAFEDAGVAALVVTEIGRDGTLEGPDVVGLGQVLEATSIPLIASGGVGTLDDLRTLAALKVPTGGVAASAGAGGVAGEHASGEAGSTDDVRTLSGAIVGRAIYEGNFTVEQAVEACK
ncbi:MAG: 1-(5-phosphoribosyl)-5-[(5-phosphoribosylamino)methylideneamino]imidazole-4-carboxamide isomerase [Microthrixaceae bacterium]